MSIEIRRAEPGDLPSVLELVRELEALQRPWRVFPSRPTLVDEIGRRYATTIDGAKDLLLVAALDGDVVGTAYAHVNVPSSISDQRAVELSGVIVHPDHRGRGIARALTIEAARFARDRGVHRLTVRVFAQNEEGLKLWPALGFEPRMLQMTAVVSELLDHQGEGKL
jgi:GNAT superfamily N-acetyltransferase